MTTIMNTSMIIIMMMMMIEGFRSLQLSTLNRLCVFFSKSIDFRCCFQNVGIHQCVIADSVEWLYAQVDLLAILSKLLY